jgi:agmatine deiminase
MITRMNNKTILAMAAAILISACDGGVADETTPNPDPNTPVADILYTFPDESETHEGTWLQWPHEHEYGVEYRNSLDATWVAMTKALQSTEKVHIIAYDATEQTRIEALLATAGVPLTNINFKIHPTNDVWVRDNGPIFAKNKSGQLVLQDWGFNGWGGKFGSQKCDAIPTFIGTEIGMTAINVPMVNEGGAVELDGHGVLMATKSAVLSQKDKSTRNAGMTQAQVEANFTKYYGATKFIWLEGGFSKEDVTDMHIDGVAKFVPGNKLVTMSSADLLDWGLIQSDIDLLFNATNKNNQAYTKVYLPLSQKNVVTTNGTDLGYKGCYINFYVANGKVLVPNYNDPNDAVANAIIAGLFPNRTVVGIDVRNLYKNGGMVHCVTQQQPK